MKEPVDPLLDEVVLLVIDVGRPEIGVMGEGVDADQPVVFEGDVLAELGEGFGIGRAGAVELKEAVVPMRGELRARRKEEMPVDLPAVAGRVERQEAGVVPRLPQEDLHERVGGAEGADRDRIGNHRVELDEGDRESLGEDEVLLRHEVKKASDEGIEGLGGRVVGVVVGALAEVGEHGEKLSADVVPVLLAIGDIHAAGVKAQQRISRRGDAAGGPGCWRRDGNRNLLGRHG